jgi:hypothetical protein
MKAWAIVALFVLYLAIAIYGCYVSGAENKLDEIQYQHNKEHGL